MTNEERKKMRELNAPVARKLALAEHERRLQTFDRFNEDFVKAHTSERQLQKVKEINKQNESSLNEFINVTKVDNFGEAERISKRLARMGVCSRRQAEKLIEQGMVKVDGKTIDHNMQVSN